MIGFVGLVQIELPGETVRMTDGGFITLNGQLFTASHPVLGSIAAAESTGDGDSDTIPALDIKFAAKSPAVIPLLTASAVQRMPIKFWVIEYDPETNTPISGFNPFFVGRQSRPTFTWSATELTAGLTSASELEVLFEQNNGNFMSGPFQQRMYPGDTGHDQAATAPLQSAWGAPAPPRGIVASSSPVAPVNRSRFPSRLAL